MYSYMDNIYVLCVLQNLSFSLKPAISRTIILREWFQISCSITFFLNICVCCSYSPQPCHTSLETQYRPIPIRFTLLRVRLTYTAITPSKQNTPRPLGRGDSTRFHPTWSTEINDGPSLRPLTRPIGAPYSRRWRFEEPTPRWFSTASGCAGSQPVTRTLCSFPRPTRPGRRVCLSKLPSL